MNLRRKLSTGLGILKSRGAAGAVRVLGRKLRTRLGAGHPPGRAEIALVCANFGGIDIVARLPSHPGIDAFYYTDAAGQASARPEAAASWTKIVVPNYPRHDFGPRLRGRYFKHQIHRLDEVRGYRWLAWSDASLRFHDLSFLTDAARLFSSRRPHQRILLVPHPDRATITDEFRFIEQEIAADNEYLTVRYAHESLPEQMEYFRSRGWDLDAPLWCATVWLIENSDLFARVMNDWWDQNLRFGLMDQLSLPVVLNAHGIVPHALPVHLRNNQYFTKVQQRQKLM